MEKVEQVLELIESMTILELQQLNKKIEEKFGIKAAAFQPAVAPAQMVAPEAAEAPTEEKKEEQTVFNVILKAVGEKKIQVIKVVREITKLGLKEAKDLVDSAPSPVREGISKEEAEDIKKKLEEVGATIEIK